MIKQGKFLWNQASAHCETWWILVRLNKGRYVFLLGAGGWAGASERMVISKYFIHWGGSNLFYSQPGEGQGKNYSMSLTWLLFVNKVISWWEKYKDSSSTLKDDSLSELYSPTQSMSLYSWFSRSIRSLSVSSFFFSLRIFIWERCSTYSARSFSWTI